MGACIAYPRSTFGGVTYPARLTIYFNGRYSNSNWNTMRHTATTTGNLTIPRASCTYNTWWQGTNMPVGKSTKLLLLHQDKLHTDIMLLLFQQQIYFSNPQTNYIHWT